MLRGPTFFVRNSVKFEKRIAHVRERDSTVLLYSIQYKHSIVFAWMTWNVLLDYASSLRLQVLDNFFSSSFAQHEPRTFILKFSKVDPNNIVLKQQKCSPNTNTKIRIKIYEEFQLFTFLLKVVRLVRFPFHINQMTNKWYYFVKYWKED